MKQLTVLLTALVGLLAPVQTLVCCALAFVCIDFVTGVVASRVRARRQRARWAFESAKAWRTVYKIVLVTVGIALTWLIDRFVLPFAAAGIWPTCSPDSYAASSCGAIWKTRPNCPTIRCSAGFRN